MIIHSIPQKLHMVKHKHVRVIAKPRAIPSYINPSNVYQETPPYQQEVKDFRPSNEDELPTYEAPSVYQDPYRDLQHDIKVFLIQNGVSLMFLGLMIYSLLSQSNMRQRIMGANQKKQVDPQSVKETFEDVAGLENAKLELQEVVEFLKQPERFVQMGAKIPKGCLLTGGPGLGKTLLARAIAGEAGVPFYACSASEFVEMFVGMGASRIRDLFKSAASNAPCIIFIDEIDAIGKTRSSGGMVGTNDEREQTINQLLTEMDGFTQNKGIVVIASTNRPDILDKALVRPGRFDRMIVLDLPTVSDRQAILTVHCKNKPLDARVDLESVAKSTSGLSGAELANIANEAAILATRDNRQTITMKDFTAAIDRVLLGPERKNALITSKRKQLVACHEAGHTVTALCLGSDVDDVSKVSIIPRGRSGGVTMFLPTSDNVDAAMYSKKYLENKLVIALGGRAAEEIVFGETNVTTGAVNDLEVVQSIARSMVIAYGFSEKLGPAAWTSQDVSSITAHQIDKEVSEVVKKAYLKAINIINNNFDLFNTIAETLYTKEELSKSDLDCIVTKANKQSTLH